MPEPPPHPAAGQDSAAQQPVKPPSFPPAATNEQLVIEKATTPFDPVKLTQAVISIDFGASYTKISYRQEMAPQGQFRHESKVLLLDKSPLIPSLAIQTDGA